ncbi:MAG: acyloxyacyl hydrolase [Cetobacterium sp.]|uniref:acyloxyacyl hydrolase n=1 Tax=unclassified Cetobacterium TaxID=2630983 RepID=UPI00163C832C|nr:acyloxyacyl hydrolase [Cetobacterium sp. 2A]MBC2855928.1 acyloxyacyl hydrolase [Cetobacterium sp. 2A]
MRKFFLIIFYIFFIKMTFSSYDLGILSSDFRNSKHPIGITLGWEQENKDYPWLGSLNYMSSYNLKGEKLDNHGSILFGKRILKLPLYSKLNIFFNFGGAVFTKISRANSSHITFFEEIGFNYSKYKLFYRHTSNAGIKGSNLGENSIVFSVIF